MTNTNAPKIYKMRVVCAAPGPVDHKQFFVRLRKMVLQSGLPFEPAKVNKNWPRLAYGPVPGYAQHSRAEYLDVYLREPVSADVARAALEKAAQGVELLRVSRVPYALPSVPNLAEVYEYGVTGDFNLYHPSKTLEEFVDAKSVIVRQTLENGFVKELDLKPFIASVRRDSDRKISLFLQKVNDQCAKPEHVIAAWLGLAVPDGSQEFTIQHMEFTREGLFWRDSEGALREI